MTIRERLRRLLAGAPPSAACPLPDCSTCPPETLDVVAEEQRAQDTNYAVWWLLTAYPDVWYFASAESVEQVAGRLVQLRTAVDAGRVAG